MGKSRSSSWSKISGQKDGGQKVWVKGDQLVSVHHKNRTSLLTTRGILRYVFGTGWAIVPSNFCLIMLPNVRPLICLLFFYEGALQKSLDVIFYFCFSHLDLVVEEMLFFFSLRCIIIGVMGYVIMALKKYGPQKCMGLKKYGPQKVWA